MTISKSCIFINRSDLNRGSQLCVTAGSALIYISANEGVRPIVFVIYNAVQEHVSKKTYIGILLLYFGIDKIVKIGWHFSFYYSIFISYLNKLILSLLPSIQRISFYHSRHWAEVSIVWCFHSIPKLN